MAWARWLGPAIRNFRLSAPHTLWLVVGVVLMVTGAKAASSVWRRNLFDVTLPGIVQKSLAEARRSQASRWAPEELTLAEASYRRGVAELRRQQARIFPFRNLRPPADTLLLAAARVQRVLAVGAARMEDANVRARQLIGQVREIVDELAVLEEQVVLPRQSHVGIAALRMNLAEATAYHDAGAFRDAEARAREILPAAAALAETLERAISRFSDEERVRTWRQWIAETVAWSRDQQAVALVVIKEKNLLDVYDGGRKVASFSADMGVNSLAQKYREGDMATPEGRYKVRQVKDRGQTRYYRAFLLDYPTRDDLRRIETARSAGTIPASARPGGLIEIHGKGGLGEDWTNGCVAVANVHMDELFKLVRVGTPVTIVGGDGSRGAFSALEEKLNREH